MKQEFSKYFSFDRIEEPTYFTNNNNNNSNRLIQNIRTSFAQQDDVVSSFGFSLSNFEKKIPYSNKKDHKLILNGNDIKNNKNYIYLQNLKNSSNIPKIFSINDEREKKNDEEKKEFKRSQIKHKTISNYTVHRTLPLINPIPQRTIEKIIKTMNKIKSKLITYNENDLVEDVDWIINEILSDKIFKLRMNERISKEESDFSNEYSINQNNIILSRDLSNYGKICFLEINKNKTISFKKNLIIFIL